MSAKKIKIIILAILIIIIGTILGISIINNNRKKYDIEEITGANYYTLFSNDKIGVINTKGEVIIEPIYDNVQIPNPLKPIFVCLSDYNKNNDSYKISIRNEKNEELFKQYDEVNSIHLSALTGESNFSTTALKYKKDNRYGLLSFEGKELTKPIYEEIDSLPYKEEEFLVKKDGKFGVLNPKGVQLLKTEYDEISGDGYFKNNYKNAGYIVGTKEENGYLYSYLTNEGKTLLKKEYNDIVRITEIEENGNIYLIASKNGKKGLFRNNKELLECYYQNLEYNEEAKLIIAKSGDKYGVYDLNGQVILPTENKELYIRGIRIITINDGVQNEYDLSGLKIRDNKYKAVSATPNEDFYITVNQSDLYGLINTKGTEVIDNKYAYLEYLTGSYFSVYSNENKIGILDNNGKIVLDMKYDVIQKIKGSNIIQAIQLEQKTIELYTEDIKQIAKKDNANIYIYDNYIKLANQASVSYFSLDGKELKSSEALAGRNLFPTVKNGKWGFENSNGEIKVNTRYASVTDFNEYGFAGVELAGKWGIIDANGNTVVEPIYTIEQKNTEPNFIGKYYRINDGGNTYYTDLVK